MERRLRQALRSVAAASRSFAERTTDFDSLLEAVARSTAEVLGDLCVVALGADEGSAVPVAVYDRDAAVRERAAPFLHARFPLIDPALSAQLAGGGTVALPVLDLGRIPAMFPEARRFLSALGARGLIAVPLRSRGELLGLLAVVRHRPDAPPLDELDRELAEHLASHAALALGNARLIRELSQSEALRSLEAQALEATRFVDAILEHIPDMVFVKEAESLRFVRFNRAGEELLGIPRAEMIGKNDFDFFPAEEAEFFVKKDRETLASRTLVDIPEEPIQTRHGERWLHTKKVTVVDEHGEPRYLLGISEDITDRKQAHAELAAAKDRAEAANRELESFSYSVAHDLRAPLRAIEGFSQALLEDHGPALDPTGQDYLARIRAAARRMSGLIDDLLALSRVSRAELRREHVDLSALARAAVTTLETADPARRVDVTIAPGLAAVGDPKLLAIVLDNLIGNAWKFTQRTDPARIEVAARDQDGRRVYFVRDNGAGFDQAYADKLFGVFQRLHSAADFPGTGIGLATVKRIIERHGGRVWAEGVAGQGATFSFTLPDA
jgi:PAS domain S-box-containing protein